MNTKTQHAGAPTSTNGFAPAWERRDDGTPHAPELARSVLLHDGVAAPLRGEIATLAAEGARRRWSEKAFRRRVRALVQEAGAGADGFAAMDALALRLFTEHGGQAAVEPARGGDAPEDPSAAHGTPCADGTDSSAAAARDGAAHPPHGRPRWDAPPPTPPPAGPSSRAGSAAPPGDGEALAAACETCAEMCLVDGRIDRARLNTEAERVAGAFRRPVDRVRQGIEEACRRLAGTGPDAEPDPADPGRRDWTDLSADEQEGVVAAVTSEAQTQRASSKGALLALVPGIAAKACPALQYNHHVGELIAGRVARRREDAGEAAGPAQPGDARKALTAEDLERIVADLVPVADNEFEAQKRLLRWEREYGKLPRAVREEAKRRARQAAQSAAEAEAEAAARQAAPVIDLACAQAAESLRDLLAAAEALPVQQRWPDPALLALAAVRDAATVAWQAQPGHAGDALPPHDRIAHILTHRDLGPLAERLEAVFGPRWTKALGGRALRDLLPGCPADFLLDEDCPWHVHPDGSVTKTVLVDDGQGGKAPSEERVLPAVIVPLEQEITLGPWGLPTAGEGAMIGQVYAWWRRHAGGAGAWVTGQTQAVNLWDQRRLTALANEGVPVDSNNAREALSWMAHLRDSAPQVRRPVFVQPGWHALPGGTPAFVLGESILTPSGRMEVAPATKQGGEASVGWQRGLDPGTRQYLAAYKTAGDAEASKDLFRVLVAQYPRIGAMAGLAYSALLLPFLRHTGALLDMAGFVLQCAGDSGLGKSTVQRLVVSLAADPRGSEIIGAFSGTAVSIGTKLASAHCLPLCFEEPQQAGFANHEQTGQTIANILYMVGQGHDRDRGAAAGGNRETKHWRSVLYLTGEHSIAGLPALEDTGAERRLVDIAPPFTHSAEMDGYIKGTIEPTITQNHGHVVPEVVGLLLRQAEALGGFPGLAKELTAWHRLERQAVERAWIRMHPEVGAKAGAEEHGKTSAQVGRFASLVAGGMMALDLLLRVCGVSEEQRGETVEKARRAAIEDNDASLCAATRKQRYLDALREAVVGNTHRIAGLEPEDGRDGSGQVLRRVPPQGYIGGVGKVYGVEVVGILPNALKELVSRVMGQYNAREFLAEMEKALVDIADPADPEEQRRLRVPVLVAPSDQRVRRGKALGLRYRRADGQSIYQTHLCFRRDALLPTAADDGA